MVAKESIVVIGAVAVGFVIAIVFGLMYAPSEPAVQQREDRVPAMDTQSPEAARSDTADPRESATRSEAPASVSSDNSPAQSRPASSQPQANPEQRDLPQAPALEVPRRLDELQLPASSRGNEPLTQTEREFEAQSKDPDWSTATEARILSAFAEHAAGLGFTDVQADCRATLCRFEARPSVSSTRPAAGERPLPGWGARDHFQAIADSVGLEIRLMFAALDGYGTPITLAFFQRAQEDSTE